MRRSRIRATAALTAALLSFACVDETQRAESGAALFAEYCASCHGTEGGGDGPEAERLDLELTDLRTLAERNGGTFDEAAVLASIDGRREVAAHGPREMPVWGKVLAEEKRGEPMPVYQAMGEARALVDHLRSIQR
ncbi:MAG: cytochrome c [Myxococcota bacterium]|nr:cytochrome c [Myxococcota bacterium]